MKHPDSWEDVGDGTWIRHHAVPRRVPFAPSGSSDGPALEDLEDYRLTERKFPDGTKDRLEDRWRTGVKLIDGLSLWRGKTIFHVKGASNPNKSVDRTHTPTTSSGVLLRKLGGSVRTIVEIC